MKSVSRLSTQAVGYFQDYEEAQQFQEVYRAFRDTAGAGCPGYETFNAHELLLIGDNSAKVQSPVSRRAAEISDLCSAR
jgi:hypothetical protein